MRKILEDLYYGNIRPSEQMMKANYKLRRAVEIAAKCEDQLFERLGEAERELLTELIGAQHEIDSITTAETFIQAFRLGIRIMAECMDENDGETTEVIDRG